MDLGLAGKVAVVTGASKGIGLAGTRGLPPAGGPVDTPGRTPDLVAATSCGVRR
jgi:NAD(P)-dependent dehydrogenase (short-subunit alcohol dehydrogenase family)